MKQYIKIFGNSYYEEVEQEVQEFLEDHDNELNIINVSGCYDTDNYYTLTIVYSYENVLINNDKL